MEILRSIPQLEAVRDEWNALADHEGHALLRHDWFLSAARTLHAPTDPAVVVTRRWGRVEGIAPLVESSAYGMRRLRFIGASALHEPARLLARDARARVALLDAMARLDRPLALERFAIDSVELDELHHRVRGQGWLVVRQTAPALRVELEGNGLRPLDRMSSKLRYDLKRARSRAAEFGDMTIAVTTPDPQQVDEALDAFIQVESSGWKRQSGSALALRPRLQEFFRTYGRLASASGLLRFFWLRIGGSIAAAKIAVEVYDRLWVLKIGYNASMARCSPGFLLTAETITYAASRGLKSYEFLGSAEDWERRWRPVDRPTNLLVFYPWSMRGCLGASLDIAGSAWRRVSREPRALVPRSARTRAVASHAP